MSDRPEPWYATGLRFGCHSCGACCRIEGHVWVDRRAIRRLADHLELSLDEFGSRYLRRVGRRYSLTEKPNHDCVFWENGCTVYEARPPQCRIFPFWKECIESPAAWTETATECRGVGSGRLYTAREIEAISRSEDATDDGASPFGSCDCDEE